MAIPPNQAPLLVKDTTATDGSGVALTLDNAAVGNGYRTFVEAFTDGDLASGDTVTVAIVDSTVGWGGVMFELRECVWTNSGGGGSLSAGTTHQPNGTPPTWPASGTRDVILITDSLDRNANGADIPTPNTFADNIAALRTNNTSLQTMTGPVAIEKDLLVDRPDTTRAAFRGRNDKGTTGLITEFTAEARSTLPSERVYGNLRFYIGSATDGAEQGNLRVELISAGTVTERLKLDHDGTLTAQPSGDGYVHLASGDTMLFRGAPPAQFARVNVAAGTAIKLAASGDTPGGTGGSVNPFATWSTSGHALTTAEIPGHTHPHGHGSGTGFLVGVSAGGTFDSTAGGAADAAVVANTGQNTGGGGSHTHSIQAIQYEIAVWGSFI